MSESLDRYGQMSEKDKGMMGITQEDKNQSDATTSNESEKNNPDVFQKIEDELMSVIYLLSAANDSSASREEVESSIVESMHKLVDLRSEVTKPEYSTIQSFDSSMAQERIDKLMGVLHPGNVQGANERQMRYSIQLAVNEAVNLFDTSDIRNEKLNTALFSK